MYEIFAALLKQYGITAYRVAKETGITTATLTDWKKGRSTPKADKLQIIAAYFGVSVDYLLGKEDSPVVQPSKLSDDAYRVAVAYDKAEPAIQSSVRKLLDLDL